MSLSQPEYTYTVVSWTRSEAGWAKRGERWATPETASRDKIELRAMLAPEEGYISKELGGRLSLGAGKEG